MTRCCMVALVALLATAAPADAASTASDTIRLLNAARAVRGVPVLHADRRLARAARGHSRDMVARGYFDHVAPGGDDLHHRVARSGWLRSRRHWRLAETLAWGSGSRAAPESIVAAWLGSPPHRRILLDPRLRRIGLGVAPRTPAGAPGVTVTADFGG
jgi:uncharacterized protein YkwD